MQVLGYNVWLHKYICFVISGFFAGISGVLLIFYTGFIAPTTIDLGPNVEVLLMVALGGAGTVLGPLVGSIVIIFLKNFISIYTQRWLIILGSIYIFTIFYAPKGILRAFQKKKTRTAVKFESQ
jgi:branched-chain amino acid transport system permease protein